ncbi:MAG: hypothetical protein LBC19_07335 [Tannerella sp.]|jgi:hypothetical protein|nr:hypothetical protein [Tannerella sp.]
MLKRVVKNGGFFEWNRINGMPSGSGAFRGLAGMLHQAIEDFRHWAE